MTKSFHHSSYNVKAKNLALAYQGHQVVPFITLVPALKFLVAGTKFIVKDRCNKPDSLKPTLQILGSTKLNPPDKFFSVIFPKMIEKSKRNGTVEYANSIIQAMGSIRMLLEKNREFYEENFSELFSQQPNREEFIEKYMDVVSKITQEHVLDVASNLDKYIVTKTFFSSKPENKQNFRDRVKPSKDNEDFRVPLPVAKKARVDRAKKQGQDLPSK